MPQNSAQAEITDLLHRYSTAIDTKNWMLLETCFTEDCETAYAGVAFHGLATLVQAMKTVHDPLDVSVHRLSNVEVRLEGTCAFVRSYVDAVLVRRDHPEGPVHHVVGRYEDEVVLLDGQWLLRTRVFDPAWVWGRPSP